MILDFLTVLGLIYGLHDLQPDNARQKLTEAHDLLKHMVLEADERMGLEKARFFAQQMVTLTESIITDQSIDFTQSQYRQKFSATKGWLLQFLNQFEHDLSSDIEALYIYVLEERRGYSIKALLRDALSLFPQQVAEHLSAFVQQNIQEAARCLLVDRWTAVGFHVMRSVEEVGRKYFFLMTGRDCTGVTMGKLSSDLDQYFEKLVRQHEPAGLLGLAVGPLDQLRRIYRDPLSHPEIITLDEEQAIDVFQHGISAISTMVRDVLAGGPHFKVQALCI